MDENVRRGPSTLRPDDCRVSEGVEVSPLRNGPSDTGEYPVPVTSFLGTFLPIYPEGEFH